MKESASGPQDLNKLRAKVLQENKESGDRPHVEVATSSDAVNTLERFEALPMEEQIRRMKEKEYDDLELFKKNHFSKGGLSPDINKLREQLKKERGE